MKNVMTTTGCYCDEMISLRDEIIKSNHSWYIERKKGQSINIHKLGVVSYLSSGVVSIYNKKTNLLIDDFQAPCIVGLLDLKYNEESYYAVTKTTCQLHSIKREDLRSIINSKNLWKNVFNILSAQMYHFTKVECIFNKKNATDIVLGSIKYINELPPDLKKNISLYNFILSRCTLSRSAIYNEIKKFELEQINICRGIIQ